mgnify:CR=1 FL=1
MAHWITVSVSMVQFERPNFYVYHIGHVRSGADGRKGRKANLETWESEREEDVDEVVGAVFRAMQEERLQVHRTQAGEGCYLLQQLVSRVGGIQIQ